MSILEPGFFKTPLTNVKRNVDNIQAIWNNAPKEVQNEYGEEFLNFSK